MTDLVKHLVARAGEELPPIEAPLYEYVLAGNGVFVRARREHIEACVQVSYTTVRGLADLEPYCRVDVPRVPEGALTMMLRAAREVCQAGMKEILFHLRFDGGVWTLDLPEQSASVGHVKPLQDGPGSSYAAALIELHSHHELQPFFSSRDDRDEQGFRLYAVLGRIFSRPALRVRVGVYGHFLDVPADLVFELPDEVVDDNQPGSHVQTCRECGCTDDNPCRGGCFWVEDELCSACLVEALGTAGEGTELWVPGRGL